MPPRDHLADADLLAPWCEEHLGSRPVEELFRSGHLSTVIGLRLADGREVVVKVRPDAPRLAGCLEVQSRLADAGFPCPRPLTGVETLGRDAANAETHVAGGAVLPSAERAARLSAEAFARLIELAPPPGEVPPLGPAPSWADWDQVDRLWPRPDGDDVDLDAIAGADWIQAAGRQARERLRSGGGEPVVGHCDWLAGNLRWEGDSLLAVHDWDSVVVESEDVLVGLAAALFSTGSTDTLATVAETEQFLAAYADARGRRLSDEEVQRSWAAGVWTRAYDAAYQHAIGGPVTSLTPEEAAARLRRCGG